MLKKEYVSEELQELYEKRRNIEAEMLFKCPNGCNLYNRDGIIASVVVSVDYLSSDNYYICECSECGETWKVSKRELEKEKKILDRKIAKLEGQKFVWLKDNYSWLLAGFAFLFSVATLIITCIKYFG